MALLIGLALNFLSGDARLTSGLAFASRSLLRWGIALVGVRVTFAQIAPSARSRSLRWSRSSRRRSGSAS